MDESARVAPARPPDDRLVRWLFLRSLAVVYLVAFVSLWMQVRGLIGHDGILPTDEFVTAVARQCDAHGIGLDRYRLLPTLCWLGASDAALVAQCAAGALLATLLAIGIAPAPCLALLWGLYLSLATVGRDFLGFQWDNLLLEAGFLAIFYAPLAWRERLPRLAATPGAAAGGAPADPFARIPTFLLRLLLFKLMFSSGVVKLASGDPTWRDLSALSFHYFTQPLPTWTAWYASQLPAWFQKLSCAGMFAAELAAPLGIFAPRRLRLVGCAAMAGLQLLILLTGNYTFFNYLTIALCLVLLDDAFVRRLVPRRLARAWPRGDAREERAWPKLATAPVGALVALVSVFQVASLWGADSAVWEPARAVEERLAPLRTLDRYGLFAVMTTTRNEIVVEGSRDGESWQAYEFAYKPGDVHRRPAFVAPLQPRLDWQMWFAALGTARRNPWFLAFCQRLLEGSPEVLALLETNPFPDAPPRFVRAELYEYRFTSFAERRESGAWWKRERVGTYLPAVSLPSS